MSEQMRKEFEAAYAEIPAITPTKETAWRCWQAALATQPQAPQGAVTDTERIDWLEGLTKVSSHGLSNCAPALFTIMPAWDQKGAAYTTLRESIDAQLELRAAPETPEGAKP